MQCAGRQLERLRAAPMKGLEKQTNCQQCRSATSARGMGAAGQRSSARPGALPPPPRPCGPAVLSCLLQRATWRGPLASARAALPCPVACRCLENHAAGAADGWLSVARQAPGPGKTTETRMRLAGLSCQLQRPSIPLCVGLRGWQLPVPACRPSVSASLTTPPITSWMASSSALSQTSHLPVLHPLPN